MIVEPAPHLHRQVIELLKEEHHLTDTRTGMHVSDLTHCLTKSYWNRVDPVQPGDDEVVLWSVGWALERVLISRLHVEPITVDGITGTPDFQLDGVPADLKSTRMAPSSSAGCAVCGEPYVGHTKGKNGHVYEKAPAIPFQLPETWKRQFMSYCWMVGSTKFVVVIVHIIPATVQVLELRFTEGELEENWQWMVDRSNVLESMFAAQDPMPFQWNEPWECERCAHSLKCGLEASLRGGKNG